jgi:REP element-mobilizing transposase RayT
METCLCGNARRFELYGLVVMPDHLHLVLTPLADGDGPYSLMQIMQTIKGTSAHRINQLLDRKGRVWQEESFDRVLRREEAIEDKVDYILLNPVRAGLVRLPWEYPWAWRQAGQAGTI